MPCLVLSNLYFVNNMLLYIILLLFNAFRYTHHPFPYPNPNRNRALPQAAQGVAFLHSNGVMHCDVKSLNFLVDAAFNVKLADLGEARVFMTVGAGGAGGAGGGDVDGVLGAEAEGEAVAAAAAAAGVEDSRDFPTNINWSAPEVLATKLPRGSWLEGEEGGGERGCDGDGEAEAEVEVGAEIRYQEKSHSPSPSPRKQPSKHRVCPKSDVWSLSLVLSEILTGRIPFDTPAHRRMTMPDFVATVRAGERPAFPGWVVEQVPWLVLVVQRGWEWEAGKRLSSAEMVAAIEEGMRVHRGRY